MATPTIQMNDVNPDEDSSILNWHDNDSSDIEEEAETVNISDERIFSDILTKLQYLQSNISRTNEAKSSANKENESCNGSEIKTSKSSDTELSEDEDEERLDKTVLVEWYHILVELVSVIEDYKNDITKQNYFAVRKQTKSLSVIINTSKTWLQDDDTTYAHEIVDLYFNFFNLQHIKNYLTSNTDISDAVKLLYENCVLSNISSILEGAFNSVVCASSFTAEDLKQLIVYNEILMLMMSCLKQYYNSNMYRKCSKTNVLLLDFLITYSDKTELVPNLIKLGFPENVMHMIEIIHEYAVD
ncbi:unnamed protein product [Rotaria sp. Silwood2]|nr:unnamed protein product [Rotaria sp. Silwood2]CAF4266027.1 unnamed protein product [Rotaria sp. Silwood2]